MARKRVLIKRTTAAKLEGKRFNRLLVVKRIGSTKSKQVLWECLCDCGKKKETTSSFLMRGIVGSCGCLFMDTLKKRVTKHSQSKKEQQTTEFYTWQNMKRRCYSTTNKFYKNYGGRGIVVCDRWLNSFETFFADMGLRPSPKHSLDRFPNTNGNYEPSNCRWATKREQDRNKTNNRWIEHDGIKMIISDWAKMLGSVKGSNINYFLKKGKSFSEIIVHYNNLKANKNGTSTK